VAGSIIIGAAVVLRYLAALASELFSMRASVLMAAVGLIVFVWGFAQVWRWWLGLSLLALSIPLPGGVLSFLSFPLPVKASELGAALLRWREIPVGLQGNIISLPGGHRLFVTEACSGLRSLSALLSLSLLCGGVFLGSPILRALLVLISLPIAVLINGVR